MAYVSNKNLNLVPVQFTPTGGLNLALPPHAIADAEMSQANNAIYLPHSGQLATRPAFFCFSPTPAPGAILNMHSYEGRIICSVDDGKVYEYNTTTQTFTAIHDITVGPIASFLSFNDKLLIADGGGLFSWDGSQTVEITTTLHPTAICEIVNRVVINDRLDPDAVWFSGPEDETDWDATNGAAVGLRAGYGDGMDVNGLAPMGEDLIVSKAGGSSRYIYRVKVSGAPDQWSVHKLITDTSAKGPLMIESVPNAVLYVNEDSELRSLTGVQQYGDIRMINVGEKINPMLVSAVKEAFTPSMIRYLPSLDIMAIIFSGRLAMYHHASQRFTTITFDDGKVMCCTDLGDTPYWGSSLGYIYGWNEESSTDEYKPNEYANFMMRLKSKIYTFPGESLLKTTNVSFANYHEGAGSVFINDTKVLGFDILGSPWYLYEADDTQLYDANMQLYDRGEADTVIKGRNRCRQKDFFIEVTTDGGGRMGLNYVDCTFAMVNG